MFKSSRLLQHSSRSTLLDQESFEQVLSLERKRTDRSGRGFVLMLFDLRALADGGEVRPEVVREVVSTFQSTIRETDSFGWYARPVLGLILTDCVGRDADTDERVLRRIKGSLEMRLDPDRVGNVAVSVHRYPEGEDGNAAIDAALYRDLIREGAKRGADLGWKRLVDFSVSLVLLVLLSPLLLAIALAVRMSSKGPALFKQERMGQFGMPFTFYKFRSMYEDSDSGIHERYVDGFITASRINGVSGTNGGAQANGTNAPYKIVDDPRVTPLGKLLRKTSLDELPQLLNVLKGDMSLVGPRPPLRYEMKRYANWHRRRILEARPGITGIWQLKGRSRTTFDEMVRMDLEYVRKSSFSMDLKILLLTPWVVLRGRGAY